MWWCNRKKKKDCNKKKKKGGVTKRKIHLFTERMYITSFYCVQQHTHATEQNHMWKEANNVDY